jgi:hypothetical protein
VLLRGYYRKKEKLKKKSFVARRHVPVLFVWKNFEGFIFLFTTQEIHGE